MSPQVNIGVQEDVRFVRCFFFIALTIAIAFFFYFLLCQWTINFIAVVSLHAYSHYGVSHEVIVK